MQLHTISSYDRELLNLRSKISTMISFVEKQHQISIAAFKGDYIDIISESINIDKKINLLDDDIENLAVQILALRSPTGQDLREAVSSIKIAVILERMGDLSKNTISRMTEGKISLEPEELNLIITLHDKISKMISRLDVAYKNFDIDLSRQIFLQDREIDQFYIELRLKLEKFIENNPVQTKKIITVIFALKNYERFADYVSKIAAHVLYIVTSNKKFVNL